MERKYQVFISSTYEDMIPYREAASNAIIVGFNVRPDPVAAESAERDGVDIRLYSVIVCNKYSSHISSVISSCYSLPISLISQTFTHTS